jgi:DNA-binding MurR/RpiR family transcriptional regulator
MWRPEKAHRRLEMSDILVRIREAYGEMTPGYQALAQYITDHPHEIAFASAARVATLAGTSAATVVRFSEFIGFEGYSELQAIARQELQREVNTVSRLERAKSSDEPTSIYESVVRADIANLNAMLTERNAKTFEQAVQTLSAARCIHLVGLRSTHALVTHLEAYLGWIGRSTSVLKPGIGNLPEQLLAIKPGDACICISLRRYTKDTLEIARAAKGRAANLVAITDSELSPLAELAGLSLIVPVKSPAFYESKTAALSLTNALLLGIALSDRPRTIASLKLHEQTWVDNHIYANEHFRGQLRQELHDFTNFTGTKPAAAPLKRRQSTQKPTTKSKGD